MYKKLMLRNKALEKGERWLGWEGVGNPDFRPVYSVRKVSFLGHSLLKKNG